MDEFERKLREGLADEVEGYAPRAGRVPATSRLDARRLAPFALAGLASLVLIVGGLTVGLRGGGHQGGPATLAAVQPSDTDPAATPSPVCSYPVVQNGTGPENPGGVVSVPYPCTPGTSPTPACLDTIQLTAGSCAIAPALPTPCATVAAVCGSPSPPVTGPPPSSASVSAEPSEIISSAVSCIGGATRKATPAPPCGEASGTASSSPSPTATLKACTAADFTTVLTIDKIEYATGEPVNITARVTAKVACQAAATPGITGGIYAGGSATGTAVEGIGVCAVHDGVSESCPYFSPHTRVWKAGESDDTSDSWNQVKAGSPGTTVDPGTFTVVVQDGPATATGRFAIQAAECTAQQIKAGLTSDQPSYAQGSTASFTVSETNTSSSTCQITPDDARTQIPAVDASGTTVWAGCGEGGLAYGSQCVTAAYALAPVSLAPGQTISFTKKWDLTADGTKAHPDPAPVPDGSYTLTYTAPVAQTGNPTATTTITVTG